MGVRLPRTAPWWLTWLLLGGLGSLFLGERVLATVTAARAVLSGLGALAVLGCLAWRIVSWRGAEGEARSVERMLLVSYGGCVLALAGYLVSSEDGMRWLGIAFAEDEARSRYRVIVQVLWTIVLASSLLPALGVQLALGAHRHARGQALGLEGLRVAEMAAGGATIALAAAFLFLLGYIASERDKTLDVSYFKTSSPGTATQAAVSNLSEALRVLLFFPDVNPVKDEALRYFRSLADATGRVQIEEYDRLVSPRLALEHQVTEDGTIILLKGDRRERISLPAELPSARSRLRRLDREVQTLVMTMLRERRTAYLSVGHGEANDPESRGPLAAGGLAGVNALKEILHLLNYDVEDLGLQNGLGQDVPDDAAMVIVLGPRRPFLREELASLDRHLQRGGSLLLALDPEGDFRMGPVEERLGVRFVPVPLADDRQYLRQRGNLSDRRLIITDRFSSHAAVTTLGRAGVGAGILLAGAGYLERTDTAGPGPSFVVRSLPSTFADVNGNFEFDEGKEARESYDLVAAVEPKPDTTAAMRNDTAGPGGGSGAGAGSNGAVTRGGGAASGPSQSPGDSAAWKTADTPAQTAEARKEAARGMRALVYADAEMFTDPVVVSLGLNAALVADGVRWLGGEEALAGETESEEDVPIQHTKTEDVAWFYSTILGAPALVLAGGLVAVYRRRRRRRSEPQ
ncbi:MAG: Gldg family protein [Gemmatimonadetes bacterium]|nr:Gldg family protein [Gemmatimonadota bacterium]